MERKSPMDIATNDPSLERAQFQEEIRERHLGELLSITNSYYQEKINRDEMVQAIQELQEKTFQKLEKLESER